MPVLLGVNALNNVVGSAGPVGGLTGGVLGGGSSTGSSSGGSSGGSSGTSGSRMVGNNLQNGINSKCI